MRHQGFKNEKKKKKKIDLAANILSLATHQFQLRAFENAFPHYYIFCVSSKLSRNKWFKTCQ